RTKCALCRSDRACDGGATGVCAGGAFAGRDRGPHHKDRRVCRRGLAGDDGSDLDRRGSSGSSVPPNGAVTRAGKGAFHLGEVWRDDANTYSNPLPSFELKFDVSALKSVGRPLLNGTALEVTAQAEERISPTKRFKIALGLKFGWWARQVATW